MGSLVVCVVRWVEVGTAAARDEAVAVVRGAPAELAVVPVRCGPVLRRCGRDSRPKGAAAAAGPGTEPWKRAPDAGAGHAAARTAPAREERESVRLLPLAGKAERPLASPAINGGDCHCAEPTKVGARRKLEGAGGAGAASGEAAALGGVAATAGSVIGVSIPTWSGTRSPWSRDLRLVPTRHKRGSPDRGCRSLDLSCLWNTLASLPRDVCSVGPINRNVKLPFCQVQSKIRARCRATHAALRWLQYGLFKRFVLTQSTNHYRTKSYFWSG